MTLGRSMIHKFILDMHFKSEHLLDHFLGLDR